MKYRIERIEHIAFSGPVREHHFECRVAPWDDQCQRLRSLAITTEPAAKLASHRDCFGNQVHCAALLGAHDACALRMTADVETLLANPFEFDTVIPDREPEWIRDSLRQAPRLWDYVLHRSALTPEIEALFAHAEHDPEARTPTVAPHWRPGVSLLAQLQDACHWVQASFGYDPALPPLANLAELLQRREGSSADLAHLLTVVVRSWAVPVRFVSGYLDPGYFEPDGNAAKDGKARPQTLHDWIEVLIPGGGWRGIDPARGLVADDTYVRLAVGRDLRDVAGFRHSFKGDGELSGIESELDVRRLDARGDPAHR